MTNAASWRPLNPSDWTAGTAQALWLLRRLDHCVFKVHAYKMTQVVCVCVCVCVCLCGGEAHVEENKEILQKSKHLCKQF